MEGKLMKSQWINNEMTYLQALYFIGFSAINVGLEISP